MSEQTSSERPSMDAGELTDTSLTFKEKILQRRAEMRSSLAQLVLIVAGFVAVVALLNVWVVVSIADLDANQGISLFQSTFSLIFGAVAAWGGAIIAFYFGGENYESAARATQEVLTTVGSPKPALADIPVARTMITTIKTEKAASLEEVTMDRINQFFRDSAPRRLIVVTPENKFLAVLHKSKLDEAKANVADENNEREDADKIELATLADVVDQLSATDKALVTNAAFAAVDATLQQMKGAIDAIRGCQDGFVTASGDRDEAVIGYVTNVEIAQHSAVR